MDSKCKCQVVVEHSVRWIVEHSVRCAVEHSVGWIVEESVRCVVEQSSDRVKSSSGKPHPYMI